MRFPMQMPHVEGVSSYVPMRATVRHSNMHVPIQLIATHSSVLYTLDRLTLLISTILLSAARKMPVEIEKMQVL